MKNNNYKKFFITMFLSFLMMYLIMFFNVFELGHVYFSLTRFYMTLLMVSPMALLMLFSMRAMYPNKKINIAIIASSILIFILALVFLRQQVFISDKQYVKAMISHHSSAILTSQEANLQDAEVQELANDIIEAQQREIDQMKAILERLD